MPESDYIPAPGKFRELRAAEPEQLFVSVRVFGADVIKRVEGGPGTRAALETQAGYVEAFFRTLRIPIRIRIRGSKEES